MDVVLAMMGEYQGQPAALFGADEVFAGRQPERGTETCLVVEAMASLELAFTTFGAGELYDRVERLALNAMPAALDATMWANVYVQQANSVFAGVSPNPEDGGDARASGQIRHSEDRAAASEAVRPPRCSVCGAAAPPGRARGASARALRSDDAPSGEDLQANFFGVSHFPCCLTNFPQGWPKFAQHAFVEGATDKREVVVASLVPASASLDAGDFRTDSKYPFGDDATVTVDARVDVTLYVRIPSWADGATVDGLPAVAGTLFGVACDKGKRTTVKVELHPEVKVEYGWGAHGVNISTVEYAAAGASVPVADPSSDFDAPFGGSRAGDGYKDIRSGNPGDSRDALILHPLRGEGHYLTQAEIAFRYAAGYTPRQGDPHKQGTVARFVVLDEATREELATSSWSAPLDEFSFDNFTSYSEPVTLSVDLAGSKRVPNARLLLLALRFRDNQRNVQIPVGRGSLGMSVRVGWSEDVSPEPVPPPSPWTVPPVNGAVVTRGPLVFSLRPASTTKVTRNYSSIEPSRPSAADYEINATEPWNYALVLGGEGEDDAANGNLVFGGFLRCCRWPRAYARSCAQSRVAGAAR